MFWTNTQITTLLIKMAIFKKLVILIIVYIIFLRVEFLWIVYGMFSSGAISVLVLVTTILPTSWFPNHRGRVVGLISSGFGLSSTSKISNLIDAIIFHDLYVFSFHSNSNLFGQSKQYRACKEWLINGISFILYESGSSWKHSKFVPVHGGHLCNNVHNWNNTLFRSTKGRVMI